MLTEVTVTLKAQELTIVLAGLDELPGKVGRPVYLNISQQVEKQLAEHEAKEKQE